MILTHYEILGVQESATPAEIREAYQKLMVIWRPEMASTWLTAETLPFCHELAQKITLAYETLYNEKNRKEYDMQLEQLRTGPVTEIGLEDQNENFALKWDELKKERNAYLERLKIQDNDSHQNKTARSPLKSSELAPAIQNNNMSLLKSVLSNTACSTPTHPPLLSATGLEFAYKVYDARLPKKEENWCAVHLKFTDRLSAGNFKKLFDKSTPNRQINLYYYPGKDNILYVDVLMNTNLYFALDHVYDGTYGQKLLDELEKYVDLSRINKPSVHAGSYRLVKRERSPLKCSELASALPDGNEEQKSNISRTTFFNTTTTKPRLRPRGLEVVYRTFDAMHSKKPVFWCNLHLKFENSELAEAFKQMFEELPDREIDLIFHPRKDNVLYTDVTINTDLYNSTKEVYDDTRGQKILDQLEKYVDLSQIDKPRVHAGNYLPINTMRPMEY